MASPMPKSDDIHDKIDNKVLANVLANILDKDRDMVRPGKSSLGSLVKSECDSAYDKLYLCPSPAHDPYATVHRKLVSSDASFVILLHVGPR